MQTSLTNLHQHSKWIRLFLKLIHKPQLNSIPQQRQTSFLAEILWRFQAKYPCFLSTWTITRMIERKHLKTLIQTTCVLLIAAFKWDKNYHLNKFHKRDSLIDFIKNLKRNMDVNALRKAILQWCIVEKQSNGLNVYFQTKSISLNFTKAFILKILIESAVRLKEM